MKKVYKLFLILIILSVSLFSCFPLSPNSYGNQGYRGQGYRSHGYRDYGYRDQGYRGQRERHNKHHDGYRDRGEWSYNSPHE
jgi:hypothetical protein